jgi:hypothetical protein
MAHEPATGEEIVLEVEVPEGASDADVIAAVVGLADAADGLHRAHGGHGLRVARLQAKGTDVRDDWTDEEFDAAVETVARYHRAELRHLLRHLGVCLAVVALAALAAWAVGAFQ